MIRIALVYRVGRQLPLTTVELPHHATEHVLYELKQYKKHYCCNGSIVEHAAGVTVQLAGDQRERVADYLRQKFPDEEFSVE